MANSYNYYESCPSDSQTEKRREKKRVKGSINRNMNPLLGADIGDSLRLGCRGRAVIVATALCSEVLQLPVFIISHWTHLFDK